MKRISIILLIVSLWMAETNAQPARVAGGIFRNLGPDINTQGDEYLPVIYNDTLYFRRSYGPKDHEILLTGIKNYDCMNDIVQFELIKTNTYSNTIVDANRSIRSNLSSPSFTNYSDTIQMWAPSHEMEELSSEGHDFHPAFSITGDTLVFASTRPDPDGQSDLYVAVKRPNGKWSRPRKLPRGINSDENEISPYIAPDGTLYYASKGFTNGRATIAVSGKSKSKSSNLFFQESALNYDIIKAELGNNFWTDPVKMPYPINTEYDDLGPTTYNGKVFLASNRPDSYDWGHGYGGFDLYGWCDDNCCDSTCANIAILGKVGGTAFELAPYAVVEIIQMPEQQVIRTIVLENQTDYYVEVPQHEEYAIRTYHNCLMETSKYLEERIEHDCNTCCLDTFAINTELKGGCPNCDDTNIITGTTYCNDLFFVCGSYVELFDNKGLQLSTAMVDSLGRYTFENVPKKEDYELRYFSDCLTDTLGYLQHYISDLNYNPTGAGKTFKSDFEIPESCCIKCPNVFLQGRTMCGTAHTFDYSNIMAYDKYNNLVGEALTNRFGEFKLPISMQCPSDSLRIRLITDCVIEGFVEKKVAFECNSDGMNILHLDFDYPRNCCVTCESLLFEGRIQAKGVNMGIGTIEFYRNFGYAEPEKIFETLVNGDGTFFAEIPYWPEYIVKFSAGCLQDTLTQIMSADYPCEENNQQYLFVEFDISNTPCAEDVCEDVIHNFSTKNFNIFVENNIAIVKAEEGAEVIPVNENENLNGMQSLRQQMQSINGDNGNATISLKVEKSITEAAEIISDAMVNLDECPDCQFFEITVTAYNDSRTSSLKQQTYQGREISNGDILLLPYSVISPNMKFNDILIGELRAYNLIVELQRELLNNESYMDHADNIAWKAVGAPEVKQDNNTAEIRVKCSSSQREMKKLKLTKKLPRYFGSTGIYEGMKVGKMIDATTVGGQDAFAMALRFGFDTATLLDGSYQEIDEIIEELKARPNLELEIQGYTDNLGTMEYNLELSEKRAKAVYDAIIERGDINPNRLRYRGLSYLNPQASNSTEQGRAQNRRTIFKVLNK